MAPPSAPRPSHGGRRALCSSLAQQQAARRPGHDSSSTSAPASDHGIQVPCVFFLGSGPFHSAPWTQVFILPMVGSPYEGRRAGCQHPSPSSAPFSHGAAANLHGRPLFFFLAQLLGAPARPAAIAFKFSAQQCRFKKNSSLGSPPHRVLRSICAVPTHAIAMVFETAPCSVADLRCACESS
jgi:hypothetical protein